MRYGFVALCVLLCPSIVAVADEPECVDNFETTAFGVEIEVFDDELGGLSVELKVDDENFEYKGQLARSLDWSTIEDYGTPACPEDSDCDIRVNFLLGRLPTASVSKTGSVWHLIGFACD